jgi:two-component system chemotaxis response regulator CheY
MAKKVLIVDDSQVMRAMLVDDLGRRGYIVDAATGGRSGIEKARNSQYDLVVTDQNMPGMEGLEMVKTLRQMDGYSKIPILVLTTESSEELKAKFRSAGATGWMVKPYSPDRMTNALAKVLPDSV